MKLSKSTIKTITREEPRLNDITFNLQSARAFPERILEEIEEVIAIARKFNREVAYPQLLDIDYQTHKDPDYLPHDIVKKANQWGFYTMWMPKMVGGQGYHIASIPYFFEELGSACLSISNLIGVHYLGMAGIGLSVNYKLTYKVMQEILQGEKNDDPTLCSFAITEPDAGTDTQYEELMDKGNLSCFAKKVDKGYTINGSKIFISNGHLSKWHVVIAYTDLKKPSKSTIIFLVKSGTEGFSFGKHEKKMGQRGCPASELVFCDCFISEDHVAFNHDWIAKEDGEEDSKSAYAFSAAQGSVGGHAAGCARGAFEDATQFAAETKVNGELLINQEWAQCILADMYRNATVSRYCFIESNLAYCQSVLSNRFNLYSNYIPHRLISKIILPMMSQKASDKLRDFLTSTFKKMKVSRKKVEVGQRIAGLGSLSKFTCTDLGMKNCELALELMGQAGIRHDRRVEKRLRDIRLLQIYEGTNQLNRLNLFKHLIARSYPQAEFFHD